MQLLDHASISVKNIESCVDFYDEIMNVLGCEKVYQTERSLGYGIRCKAGQESHSCIAIYASVNANTDDARHWCFKAKSRKEVEDFYVVCIANGGVCNGRPGVRAHYHENYFGAFLFDPFGNRVEAVYHGLV
jgi:catechol 2,3-dioxygenase-like lactoylglutathione lyase family enzyme